MMKADDQFYLYIFIYKEKRRKKEEDTYDRPKSVGRIIRGIAGGRAASGLAFGSSSST